MNDNIAPIIVGCFLVLTGVVGITYKVGAAAENSRIYQKCLIKHTELPHGKAVETCTEVVK